MGPQVENKIWFTPKQQNTFVERPKTIRATMRMQQQAQMIIYMSRKRRSSIEILTNVEFAWGHW